MHQSLVLKNVSTLKQVIEHSKTKQASYLNALNFDYLKFKAQVNNLYFDALYEKYFLESAKYSEKLFLEIEDLNLITCRLFSSYYIDYAEKQYLHMISYVHNFNEDKSLVCIDTINKCIKSLSCYKSIDVESINEQYQYLFFKYNEIIKKIGLLEDLSNSCKLKALRSLSLKLRNNVITVNEFKNNMNKKELFCYAKLKNILFYNQSKVSYYQYDILSQFVILRLFNVCDAAHNLNLEVHSYLNGNITIDQLLFFCMDMQSAIDSLRIYQDNKTFMEKFRNLELSVNMFSQQAIAC